MSLQRPLLVSNDADLIDDVLRLSAANGVEVHLAADADAARSRWTLAPLVVVGEDALGPVAQARLTRRRDVVLITREPSTATWQRAVEIGAEHVVALPEAERWLIDRLADSGEGPTRAGRVVGITGCGGGAGASTFAATLAVATPAFADRIDGEWCNGTQSLQIEGPSIRTPGGNQITGDYSRHGFAYVVPANEPEAGAKRAR